MRQLHDEDLILYFYGEAEDPEEVRTLLAGSPELSARYDALRRTLETAAEALPVPERPESYGAEVWERLQPYLTAGAGGGSSPLGGGGLEQGGGQEGGGSNHPGGFRGDFGHPPPSLPPFPTTPSQGGGTHRPHRPWKSRRALAAWATAAALLLALGFLAGRLWPRPGDEPRVAETTLPAEALILEAIEKDPDLDVRKKAVFALSQLPEGQSVPHLIRLGKQASQREIRKEAFFWLAQSDDPDALKYLDRVLNE